MAVPSRLYKSFQNFLGLDLRSSDLLREKGASTSMKNVQFRPTGAMSKRKGYQHRVRSNQGSDKFGFAGLTTFDNVDIDTGIGTEEVISAGDNLYKLTSEDLTLTYSGSNTGAYSMTLNTSTNVFELILLENGAAVSTIDLGTGRGASDETISDLETAVDLVTDWALSTPVDVGSEKAAYLPIVTDAAVATTATLVVSFYTQIAQPHASSPNPFTNYLVQATTTDFENVSFADLNNVLYVSNGYDALHKYDGNRVFKAGMDAGGFTSAATGVAGVLTGDFDYKSTYEFKDAKGNIVEGVASSTKTVTGAATDKIDLVIPTVQETTGYNTSQGEITAGATSATVTMGNGHEFKANDYLYIDDNGTIKSKRVISTTSTTVVLEDSITSTTGYASSIKINIWRTKNYSGSVAGLFYLQTENVNRHDAASISVTDNTADSALDFQFVDPIKSHGVPPVGKYLTTFQNQLMISGKPDESRTVFYSDIDSPEYFPAAANSFDVDKTVTGLNTLSNTVYVFKNKSISSVNGDFVTDNFNVSEVSREGVGCVAHHTIKEVNNKLWFLSDEGVFSISNEGLEPQGRQVDPKFAKGHLFGLKQAVAINWTKQDKYLLFLPDLTQASGNRISSGEANSVVLVFDYFREAWLEWNTFNFMGGITVVGDDLYFTRRVTSSGALPESHLNQVLLDGIESDYANHEAAIDFEYNTHWETLQDPSVWKKFLRIKMHSIDASLNTFEGDTFTLTVKTQHDYKIIDVATLSIDFSGGAEGYGIGDWSEFPWGEARLLSNKNKLASRKVKAHKLIFANNVVHENILISGYELEVVTPYQITLKE